MFLEAVGKKFLGNMNFYKILKIFRTGELSAVKVVKLEAGDNFAVIQQEILLIRDCVHPNIIAYHGSYLRRDRLWIVMEYCSGGSLQDIYHSNIFGLTSYCFFKYTVSLYSLQLSRPSF